MGPLGVHRTPALRVYIMSAQETKLRVSELVKTGLAKGMSLEPLSRYCLSLWWRETFKHLVPHFSYLSNMGGDICPSFSQGCCEKQMRQCRIALKEPKAVGKWKALPPSLQLVSTVRKVYLISRRHLIIIMRHTFLSIIGRNTILTFLHFWLGRNYSFIFVLVC